MPNKKSKKVSDGCLQRVYHKMVEDEAGCQPYIYKNYLNRFWQRWPMTR